MKYKLIHDYFIQSSMLIISMLSFTAQANHIVSLNFRSYPVVAASIDQQFNDALRRGTHLHNFQKESKLISGIFATYAGYISISDYDGRISFPRLQQSSRLYLIVTPEITPILMLANTIHHWELNQGAPVKTILAEQKEDPETELLYWDLQEVDAPADSVIPLASITILARPEHVYIPLGISVAMPSPHLLLPDIYIKSGINKVAEALYILNLNQFFGTLSMQYKLDKKDMRSLMKL